MSKQGRKKILAYSEIVFCLFFCFCHKTANKKINDMFQILNIFVLIIMSYGSKESGIPSIKNFNVFPLLQELICYNNSY